MGTSHHSKATNSSPYGSFGNTKIKNIANINHVKVNQHGKVNNKHVNNHHDKVKNENANKDNDDDTTDDVDSGMSSEENEDSLRLNLSPKVSNNLSSTIDKQEVVTKCLMNEPQCAVSGNEIPSCSNGVEVKVIIEESPHARNLQADERISEFVVIDLACDVVDVSELSRSETDAVGISSSYDCDEPSDDSMESLCLVPVANNEIARRENQKLLSLSLSILLAALLQAMRCFAQFLEDIIVIPQR